MKILRINKYYLAGPVSIITFLVYLKSLQDGFVGWDDNFYVTANPFIRSLNVDFCRWAFFEFYSYNWHPLTWISHAVDFAVWGLNPIGHHLTNNLIHTANTFLVTLLVTRVMEETRYADADNEGAPFLKGRGICIVAGTTGLLFGLHPIHVESVAWVAERKDLLCALFFLLSILSYLKYAQGSERGRPSGALVTRFLDRWYLASLGLFIFALLSKPMAVSLPIVLMILDWHPLERIGSLAMFRTAVVEKFPFLGLSILSSIVTVLAQQSGKAILEEIPLSVRGLVAARSLLAYLWNMVWPLDLLPFYPYPRDVSLSSPAYVGVVALAVGITAACFVAAKRRKVWLSAWSYYVVSLAPVLGIVQVGGQSMADRYTYLPSLGPFLVFGILTAWWCAKVNGLKVRRRTAKTATAAGILLLFISLSALTVRQIGIWKSGIDLWTYVIAKEPDKVLFAYYSRGHALSRAGRYQEAIEDYSKVIALNYKEYSPSYVDRGLTYLKVGQVRLAMADFRKACALGNDFACRTARSVENMFPR